MELNEFVSQSLIQIYKGVRKAQIETNEFGGTIVPEITQLSRGNKSIHGVKNRDPIISVDFDVALTTIDSNNSKAGFGLFIASFSSGIQAGSETSNNQLNRLQFSIPVVLPFPPGDQDDL